MRQSNRLIINTLVTYLRMALTVGIGLMVTRMLLQAIGTGDYGILTALGASGPFLMLLTEALSQSAQRHLAYEIGRNDFQRIREVFTSASVIYACLALGILVIGAALYPLLFILDVLTIPAERKDVAQAVYILTVVGTAFSTLFTPYRALLMSHQEMVRLAVFEMVQRLASLAVVLLLFVLGGDNLLNYAIMTLTANILLQWILIVHCLRRFPESRPSRRFFQREQLGELFSFAGWNTLSAMTYRLRMQGSVIALNIFFGPVVNAAMALALVLVSYVLQLSFTVQTAMQPVMTAQAGRNDQAGLERSIILACKYSIFTMLFLLVPMMIETEALLNLWLGEYPPHTPVLVRLSLLSVLITRVGVGYNMGLMAVGDIKKPTIIVSGIHLLSLTLGILAIWLWAAPPATLPGFSVVGIVVAVFVYYAFFAGQRLKMKPSRWYRQVVWPVLFVGSLSAAGAFSVKFLLEPGAVRLIVITCIYGVLAVPLIWWLGFEPWERAHFKRFASTLKMRLTGRSPG